MTAVAVVLCSRDRAGLLETAVAAVARCLRPDDEAVVVDSASLDRRACEPAERAGLRVIRADRPGLSVARNAGVAATAAPLLAFTDDDCLPDERWTGALDSAFSDDSTGFVTGPALADRVTPLPVSVTQGAVARRFGAGDDPFRCGTGANMAFRRTALDAEGPFDEVLGAGAPLLAGEDVDMFWRLLRAGWAGRFDPGVIVTHQQWRSTGRAIRLGYGYGVGGGALAAKAIRQDGRSGWRMLGHRLGRDGVVQLARDTLKGFGSGAAMDVLLLAGTAAGAVRGATRGLADGRFT